MRENRGNFIARATADRPGATGPLAGAPEPDVGQVNAPRQPRSLDWREAICAAEARLNEVRIGPGTGDQPLVAGAAVELAAELCAFGMLADEVDHMRTRADERPAGKQPTRENGHRGNADEAPFSGSESV
jgi:hypothetical protein